jgi:hyperosmotically inducible periplasmic protein
MKRVSLFALTVMLGLGTTLAQTDNAIQIAVRKALNTEGFEHVQASVQDGVVTVTGSVALYQSKIDLPLKIIFIHGVHSIQNEVEVATQDIPDRRLRGALNNAILGLGHPKDRPQGISVHVHDGTVILSGYIANQEFATEVAAVAANTRGVKDVINKLQVNLDPTIIEAWPNGAYAGGGISTK